jgi:hypothetical protein
MEQGVIVRKIAGEVLLKQGSTKTRIEKKFKMGVNVKCEIQTAELSYSYITERIHK